MRFTRANLVAEQLYSQQIIYVEIKTVKICITIIRCSYILDDDMWVNFKKFLEKCLLFLFFFKIYIYHKK